jgi:quinol monooxygenase YgiN
MNNNQIHVRAEFTIEKGKIEEFKKLIQDMSRIVENNELDTINYQFYLNRSETKCMVHETYTNSESTLAHITGIASKIILPKIFNISKLIRLDVYGNLSEELQNVITSFDSQTFSRLLDSIIELDYLFRIA